MEEKLQKLVDSINVDKFQETFRLKFITKDILRTKLNTAINLNPETL